MLRFLRYAVEHDRKIRAVFLLEGKIVQKTVHTMKKPSRSASAAKKRPSCCPWRICSAATMRAATTARNNGGSS